MPFLPQWPCNGQLSSCPAILSVGLVSVGTNLFLFLEIVFCVSVKSIQCLQADVDSQRSLGLHVDCKGKCSTYVVVVPCL